MSPKKEPERHSTKWPAVSRQAEAIEKIDRLVKGDEPIGEKLKEVVDDQRATRSSKN
jgi:hypothetical protein